MTGSYPKYSLDNGWSIIIPIVLYPLFSVALTWFFKLGGIFNEITAPFIYSGCAMASLCCGIIFMEFAEY